MVCGAQAITLTLSSECLHGGFPSSRSLTLTACRHSFPRALKLLSGGASGGVSFGDSVAGSYFLFLDKESNKEIKKIQCFSAHGSCGPAGFSGQRILAFFKLCFLVLIFIENMY